MGFSDYLGTSSGGGGDSGGGFLSDIFNFLKDPATRSAMANIGGAISPPRIIGGHLVEGPGARIAAAAKPGIQGDAMQQKAGNVSNALANNTTPPGTGGVIPGKASSVLGNHSFDLSSPDVTGITHKNPDGSSVSVSSPGPQDYMNAQVIQNQIASGQIPPSTQAAPTTTSPSTLPIGPPEAYVQPAAGVDSPLAPRVSDSLGNQSPFVASQGSAGAPGSEMIPAVLNRESGGRNFNANGSIVTSPKGAQYAMQVMPGTQRDPGYGVTPAHMRPEFATNPAAAVNATGQDYLAAMVVKYGGDKAKALAAYNAGPGAVDSAIASHGENYLQALPAETQAYVPDVLSGSKPTGQMYAQAQPQAQAQPTMTDAYQTPPQVVPSTPARYSGYLGAPVGGMTPESVTAATKMGMEAAQAPYTMAHTAAQTALTETQNKILPITAAHTQAETDKLRLGMPTEKAVPLTLPNGQQVMVKGHEAATYFNTMQQIESLERQRIASEKLYGQHAELYKMQAQREELEQKAADEFAQVMDKNGPPLKMNGIAVPWSTMAKMDRKGFIERFMPALVRADAAKEVAAGKEGIGLDKQTISAGSTIISNIAKKYGAGVAIKPDGSIDLGSMAPVRSQLEAKAKTDAAAKADLEEWDHTHQAMSGAFERLNKRAMGNPQPAPVIEPPTAAPTSAANAPQVMPLPPGIPEGSQLVPGMTHPSYPNRPVYLTPTGEHVVPRS